jgi:hypothetical protein
MNPSPMDWKTALSDTYTGLMTQLVQLTPRLLGAIGLVLAGWLVATLARAATVRLIGGLDWLLALGTRWAGAGGEQVRRSYARVTGALVWWAVMAFFAAAAVNTLGSPVFSVWMERFGAYLPRLFAGLLILLAGVVVARAVRPVTAAAAASAGLAGSEALARAAQGAIVVAATIVGAEQIGIQVEFLTVVLPVVVGVLLLGGALAFSLGARDFMANVVGARHARRSVVPGAHLRIGDVQGEVLEVTAVVLETAEGRAVVPARRLQEEVTVHLPDPAVAGEPHPDG